MAVQRGKESAEQPDDHRRAEPDKADWTGERDGGGGEHNSEHNAEETGGADGDAED